METTIHYVSRNENLKTEKAFSTDSPVDHVQGVVGENTKPDHRRVTVTAIEDPEQWKLDVHGFCVLRGDTRLDPDKVYQTRTLFKMPTGMSSKQLCMRTSRSTRGLSVSTSLLVASLSKARKRDPDYPEVVRVYSEKYEQPSAVAHSDYSQNGSATILNWCFPGNGGFWNGKRFDMLNVWRPLKQPSDDWPLAICDYTTIDKEHDILLNDAIRRDCVEEICLLHANEAHKWYYSKDQGPNDLLVFRQADSHGEKAREFHAAVCNFSAEGSPRESVEIGLVAIY